MNKKGVVITILAILVIAIVVVLLVTGKRNSGDQEASILGIKTAKMTATKDSKGAGGIIHLVWGNDGKCYIASWDNGNAKWVNIGILNGVTREKDCRDLASRDSLNNQLVNNATTSGTGGKGSIAVGSPKEIASVIDLRWMDGRGCTAWRWDDDKHDWVYLGSTSVSKDNCKALTQKSTSNVIN